MPSVRLCILGLAAAVRGAAAGPAPGGPADGAPVGASEGGPTPRDVTAGGRCGVKFGTSCQEGDCCSKEGWCGTGYLYCSSPACQIGYSDSCDGNIRPRGPDTEDVPRPHVGPVPYGEGVYHCEVYGDIALSFDDGPFDYTEYLLDLLASYNARATFFVTCRNLGKGAINDPALPWRALIRRMVDEGHQVASHTWSHQRLPELDRDQVRRQVIYNEIALADILGFFPTYLRPPYSASNSRTDRWLGELGYHVTYFNLDTEGYLHDSPGLIQQSKAIWDAGVEGRDPRRTKWLQIEHDTVYQAVHNLTEHMLRSLFRNGFRPVPVGECLRDPPENWYRTLSPTGPTTAPGSAPTTSRLPSTDGRCGRRHGGTTCLREPGAPCCSRAGWCGATGDHCGEGCQAEHGICSN